MSELSGINIKKIYEDALADPELLSTININKILDTLECSKTDYLENKTFSIIHNDIIDALRDLDIKQEQIEKLSDKLVEYRYVDEICHLHKGKYVRWMKRDRPGELTKGGVVMNIIFLETGVNILCINLAKRFIQYRFDDCITFQKLNMEEQLILMAYDHLEKENR
jgi:hypothetical protein